LHGEEAVGLAGDAGNGHVADVEIGPALGDLPEGIGRHQAREGRAFDLVERDRSFRGIGQDDCHNVAGFEEGFTLVLFAVESGHNGGVQAKARQHRGHTEHPNASDRSHASLPAVHCNPRRVV
jgi:hypothetical protein